MVRVPQIKSPAGEPGAGTCRFNNTVKELCSIAAAAVNIYTAGMSLMNTDIRLSVGFFSHPKTIKLMRQAGAEGVVCLQRLWIWAAQNRVDGCLVGFEADDIEIVAGWSGELGFLVRTLESLRFLDRNGDVYCLHGWAEHQEYVTQEPARIEKSRKAAQKRWSNARRNANDGNGGNAR